MELPDHIDELVEGLDAAIFSGDTFVDDACRAEMLHVIGRWQRELERLEELSEESDLDGDD